MYEIASYRRQLPVSLERMFENAIDWEHLPYLHASTFADLELLERSPRHWRASVRLRPAALRLHQTVELTLDRDSGVWVTEVLDGVSRGMKIHTRATALAERRIEVVVRFLMPKRRLYSRVLGPAFVSTYRRLYDEDEAMMVERQAALDRAKTPRSPGRGAVRLGDRATVLRPGFTFDHGRGRFGVAEVDGELVAYSVVCPHMLGPLGDAPVTDGQVRCPWHDYCFDLRTGRDTEHGLRLAPAPALELRDEAAWIAASADP
ncbi:MAG: Rieske (2Fe-2S) protein [Myxococcota bacterium]